MARKTDKKTEQALIAALTRVCDAALVSVPGFKWITHFADYRRFPASLLVVSVFETDAQLRAARAKQQDQWLAQRIIAELQAVDIRISDREKRLRLDSEEACERDNSGDWLQRYRH